MPIGLLLFESVQKMKNKLYEQNEQVCEWLWINRVQERICCLEYTVGIEPSQLGD